MPVAVAAGIHDNLEAFEAVLADRRFASPTVSSRWATSVTGTPPTSSRRCAPADPEEITGDREASRLHG